MLATLSFHVAQVNLPELWSVPSQFHAQTCWCHGSDGGWFQHPGSRPGCGSPVGASRQPACSSHFSSRDARLHSAQTLRTGPGCASSVPASSAAVSGSQQQLFSRRNHLTHGWSVSVSGSSMAAVQRERCWSDGCDTIQDYYFIRLCCEIMG